MAWWDSITRMFRPKPEAVDYTKWLAVMQQAGEHLDNRNLAVLTDLVRSYRNSGTTIMGICDKMNHSVHRFLATPQDAAGKDVITLMAALRKTFVVRNDGNNLAHIDLHTNNPVFGTLAMHTFLLNDYLKQHPESKLRKPPLSEVEAAVRIVENHFHHDTLRELRHVAESDGRYIPSYYVAHLNGWYDDLDGLRSKRDVLNNPSNPEERQQVGELEVRIRRIENRRVREAEMILECDPKYSLPPTYIQKLDAELDILGWLARFPEKVDDRNINRKFLDKYGIQPDISIALQWRQIEDSFRKLDARIVRLTGRRPYANELFEALKRKEPKPSQEKTPKECRPCATRREERHPEASHTQAQTSVRKMRR